MPGSIRNKPRDRSGPWRERERSGPAEGEDRHVRELHGGRMAVESVYVD